MNLGILIVAAAFAVPSEKLTPGSIFPTATAALVCKSGYSHATRQVNDAMKRAVCKAYGKRDACPKGYEIDHRVPVALGGDNSDRNLWPSPWLEARDMDKLEDRLWHDVCAHRITLPEAQRQINEAKAKGIP